MKSAATANLTNSFPDYYRVFVWNGFSVCINKCGGIDELKILPIEYNGSYPIADVIPLQICGRVGNKSMERPLFGSAIAFYGVSNEKRNYPLYAQKVKFGPCGFQSSQTDDGFHGNFNMLLADNAFTSEFYTSNLNMVNFITAIDLEYFNRGKFSSSFNPLPNDTHARIPEDILAFANKNEPFPAGSGILSFEDPSFMEKENLLLWKISLKYPFATRTIFMGAGSDRKLECRKEGSMYYLKTGFSKDVKIHFSIALGKSEEEVYARIKENCSDFRKKRSERKKLYCNIENTAPEFYWSGHKNTEKFMKDATHYFQALLVTETPDYAGIKAAAGKYGFCAIWDHTLSIRGLLLTGRFELCAKMLRYQAGFPNIHVAVTTTTLWICQLNDYYSFTGDLNLLRELFPALKLFYRIIEKSTCKENGFLKCGRSYGVDKVEELGFDSTYFSSDVNGIAYNMHRSVENISYLLENTELAAIANANAAKLEKNYLLEFYDEETGYLHSGFPVNNKTPAYHVFQNVATMGMLYPYGYYLMRSVLKNLAEYQANQLYSPRGMAAVAYDSRIKCEMWKHFHMNQHSGHESILARLGGIPETAARLSRKFLETYSVHKTAVETFNLSGCDGDESQNADWQAFSAAEAIDALFGGIAGIMRHSGGLFYAPANENGTVDIRNFRYRGAVLEIHISGKGTFIESSLLNQTKLEGSLQIPDEFWKCHEIQWNITRSEREFEKPYLMACIGSAVTNLKSKENSLTFEIVNKAHACVCIFSPWKTTLLLNEIPMPFQRAGKFIWFDHIFAPSDIITIKIKQQIC